MRIDIVSLFPEFVAQCAAFVLRAEQAAALQLRHDLLNEGFEACG